MSNDCYLRIVYLGVPLFAGLNGRKNVREVEGEKKKREKQKRKNRNKEPHKKDTNEEHNKNAKKEHEKKGKQ